MIQLRCTQKLLKEIGIAKSELCNISHSDSILGNWYANIFIVDRRKAIVFVSERTFLSFIVYGVNKRNIKVINEIFINGLSQLLSLEGFSKNDIEKNIKRCEEIQFTTTNSKTVLGNVNDIVNSYKYYILYDGGLKSCNLSEIITKINRTPQRNLNWATSIETVKEIMTMKTA
jgi:hypothetical protein